MMKSQIEYPSSVTTMRNLEEEDEFWSRLSIRNKFKLPGSLHSPILVSSEIVIAILIFVRRYEDGEIYKRQLGMDSWRAILK